MYYNDLWFRRFVSKEVFMGFNILESFFGKGTAGGTLKVC